MHGGHVALFGVYALFIMAITIPFDIRDIRYDREARLITYPVSEGIKKSKIRAILYLVCALGLLIFLFAELKVISILVLVSTILCFALVAGSILGSNEKRGENYFIFLRSLASSQSLSPTRDC